MLGTKLRRLACGGAAIADSIRTRFAQAGYPIFQGYGLTEASPVVCSNRASDDDNVLDELVAGGTMGRPMPPLWREPVGSCPGTQTGSRRARCLEHKSSATSYHRIAPGFLPFMRFLKELILLEEAWSVDNGFANFKVGLKRKQIEQHLSTRFRLKPFL